jgi:uncharacterized protein YdaU (DUF1376 family)
MKKQSMAALGIVLLGFMFFPVIGWGAAPCPPELAEAKAALGSAEAAQKKKGQTAKSQEIQAPRAQAGARTQDIQSPRSQDIQSPRSQDIQSPRSQDIQSPRSQDIQSPRSQDAQSPRSQDIQAPRIDQARALIRKADAACKKGDMALATKNAKEALTQLK